MRSPLAIAVCGCGPAGLAAAILLRRAGHQVRIMERFETPQPVGSGLILQPTGLRVLAELGVLHRITELGARIDRLFGRVVPSQRIVLDVRYAALGSQTHGIAVHRATLFEALHEAAVSAHIEIVSGAAIVGIDRSGGRPTLVDVNGRRLGTFDLVVDALGANSTLAPPIARRIALPYGAFWANVPWPEEGPMVSNALEQRYHRASRMAGLLPIGRRAPGGPRLAAFFWSLRRDRFALWKAEGIQRWKAEVHQLWPQVTTVIESIVEPTQLTFAQYDHFMARTPYSDRVVHIGDAARATSPQLGQGANMALLDALALCLALEESADLPKALHAYARMRYWHAKVFQWASATFTPFYQSDSRTLPFVRDWLASPLSRMPIGDRILARLVSGMTIAPLRQ